MVCSMQGSLDSFFALTFITFKMPLIVRYTFILHTTNKGKKPTDSVKMIVSSKIVNGMNSHILE